MNSHVVSSKLRFSVFSPILIELFYVVLYLSTILFQKLFTTRVLFHKNKIL